MTNLKLPRRRFLGLAAGAAALPFAPHVAKAQAYPSRPVKLVVGYPAGGAADIVARLIGAWLSERLGQQFVVENRPGAATNIATEMVVRAPADGYTLLFVSTANAVNATLYDNLNFNFIRDIVLIAGVVRVPHILEVNPSVPVKTVPEFIAYVKANPGKINVATVPGTTIAMAAELFKMMTGVEVAHVPYRGGAPMMTDVLSGQMQVSFDVLTGSMQYIKAGTLRPLAVTTAMRSPALPDVPTISEFLPGFDVSAWNGIGAPKSTPAEIVGKLNTEINAGLADSKIKARLSDLAGMPIVGSPMDFSKLIADDTEKWAKVVRFAGLKPE
jgi:tripartite-type tricarboxylate transporter receptor subunit TctC